MNFDPLLSPATTTPKPFGEFPLHALMPLGPRPPNVFVRGQGSWLWDATGRRHLDAVQGWAVNTLGHAPPQIAQALARQAGTLLQAGPGFHNAPALALAERLTALSGLARAFICTSGAEANEGAVKLARKWGQLQRGGASTIISFGNSFHGRTLAMMAASGKPGFGEIFPPAVPGFVHCPYNDLDAVRRAIGPDTVAVMLELVQGKAGVVPASPAFVQGLRALSARHGLGAVHGHGLLLALALPPALASGLVADAARTLPGDTGLLVNPAQPQRLRLIPALNIGDGEIHQLLQLLHEALIACTQPA